MNELTSAARSLIESARSAEALPTETQLGATKAAILQRAAVGVVALGAIATAANAKGAGVGTVIATQVTAAPAIWGKVVIGLAALAVVGGTAYLASRAEPQVSSAVAPPASVAVLPAAASSAAASVEAPVASAVPDPPVSAGRAVSTDGVRARRRPAASARTVAGDDGSELSAQLKVLRDAHAAMQDGRAEEALALLDRSPTRGGALADEQRATRILALCKLGRQSTAEVERFLQGSPRSPLAARVRHACVKK